MRIECAMRSIHLGRWFGNRLKLDYIIIHDLHEATPTMRSFACSLAWLFMACGACYIASFLFCPCSDGEERGLFSEGQEEWCSMLK